MLEPWARSLEGLGQAKPKLDERIQKGQLSQSWRAARGAREQKLRNVSHKVLSPEADEWTWTKIFLEIKGVVLWVILYGCYPTIVPYSLFLSISSTLCLPFTWHLSKCRQYHSTKNKAVEFCFILLMGKVLTFHKVRAGINLPDDLATMRTIDSTVLIVQKVFRQYLIYMPKKGRE